MPWATWQWAATTPISSKRARASEYLTKAFQLREHASEREKLAISARYYSAVTGELDKAAQTYQEAIESYPREWSAYGSLGLVFANQGQYEKAVEVTRQASRLAPDRLDNYANLANYTLALQRFEEVRQLIHQVQARKYDDFILHNALYALAFLGSDPAAMGEQQQWFAGRPEENFGLALASDTEAYGGHLAKASDIDQAGRGLRPTGGQQGNCRDMANECRGATSGLRQSHRSPADPQPRL